VCDAVEGRFLSEVDVPGLVAAARRAQADGVDVVFLTDDALGDAIVLAAGLAPSTDAGLLLGVRTGLGDRPHRHPTVLAREMTTLDHVSEGRSTLAFRGPFAGLLAEATGEAITLCREMWRTGTATSAGPYYPAAGAINRPLPARPGGPPIALDLTETETETDGAGPPPELLALVDLVLVPHGAAPPAELPAGVDVCLIRSA
jgi:alkanesulfonate monooxygenase SsuD/methylene tetrahydromethanopterin reductase-like flavin-dependent oxidoreductase (luciferase family)